VTLPLCYIGLTTIHLQPTFQTWKCSVFFSHAKMMTQHDSRLELRQHQKNQRPITTPGVSSSPILNIQTWREFAQNFISRNSPPTVDHSNYQEETHSQRSMSGNQSTNAAYSTRRNFIVKVTRRKACKVCLFQNFSAIHNSLQLPTDERSNVPTNVPSVCLRFPLTFGRTSIATRCKWGRARLDNL